MNSWRFVAAILVASVWTSSPARAESTWPPLASGLRLETPQATRLAFDGFVGERIRLTIDHWLLRAPEANPGLLEMFRLRDREPAPNLVPWAGEFVGKYLIGGIQTLRLSDREDLRQELARVVGELIASQAEDGYLGPFRSAERLRGHWDLWGHYHALLALLMWHEATGDPAALRCARAAADLVCRTYLDTGRRALEAGSDEMNLAILHGLGRLYRVTGEPRYRRMMDELERDWERAGDYVRTGVAGVEFFQSPRPRWESLHDLQGLVELWRIGSAARYREAFEHHWRSIARWDVRNTGGFSSGEQATGNPYAPTAIETCCTIAWMALSVDMLGLTGDARVADALELGTLNAWAGAQHPSGRWCTYNTPMDGVREASAHSIVFQSRAGTPELNCCSVNGPRGWGMLGEWAVMATDDGLALNWLGPLTATTKLTDGLPVTVRTGGAYPWQPEVRIAVEPQRAREFTLRVRIPAWSAGTTAWLNRRPLAPPVAGDYLTLRRTWRKGDELTLGLDFALRAVPGAREARGCVSLYRGPVLLAWDQRLHDYDEADLPPVNVARLGEARVLPAATRARAGVPRLDPPMLVDVPTDRGPALRLCDFASAGAYGTRYRSWLRADPPLLAPVVTRRPRDGARLARGRVAFRWTRPAGGPLEELSGTLRIGATEDLAQPVLEQTGLIDRQTLVELDARFEADRWYYWEVVTRTASGATRSTGPRARFRIDAAAPPVTESLESPRPVGPQGEWVKAPLRGHPAAEVGAWNPSPGWQPTNGPGGEENGAVALNGVDQKLHYALGEWPEDDYSVALRCRVRSLPEGRIGQVFSAWCAPMDDPLRLVIEGGKVSARIEAGQGYATAGVPVEPGRWYHLVATKAGGRLTLFVDGQERGATGVPEFLASQAVDGALGGNPHFAGNEFLAVDLADFGFYARGLRAEEAKALAE